MVTFIANIESYPGTTKTFGRRMWPIVERNFRLGLSAENAFTLFNVLHANPWTPSKLQRMANLDKCRYRTGSILLQRCRRHVWGGHR